MAGFRNEIVYADNVDFSGATIPTAAVTLDGQLLIGSTTSPNIRVNTLTAGSGISVTNGHGSITIATTAPLPLTSGFFAYVDPTIANVTGDATAYTVVFNNAPYNDGVNFNVASGVYTAPATGTYFFSFSVELIGLTAASSQNGFALLNKTTQPQYYAMGDSKNASTTGGTYSFQGSTITRLTSGDTVSLQVSVANTAKNVSVNGITGGNLTSFFTGFLLSTAGAATATTYVCNSGSAVPSANTLNVLGSGGTSTTGAGSTITITSSGLGLTWHTVSVNTTMVSNSGYFCVSPGGALTMALPATSALGDTIKIALNGATSFQITQAAGQQIRLGTKTTTLGAGGSLTTTEQGDAIEIACMTANTIWVVQHSEGNFTVV